MNNNEAKRFFAREFHAIINSAMAHARKEPLMPAFVIADFIEAEIRKVPGKMLARMEHDDRMEALAVDATELFLRPSMAQIPSPSCEDMK